MLKLLFNFSFYLKVKIAEKIILGCRKIFMFFEGCQKWKTLRTIDLINFTNVESYLLD